MRSAHDCPRCRIRLALLGLPVGHALGCTQCAGVFLDDAAFAHVRQTLYARIMSAAPDSLPRSRQSDTSAALACPSCRSVMRRTAIEGVDVDFCAGHGTWFDRDELVAIAHAIALTKAYGPRPSATGHELGEGPGVQLSEERIAELARSVKDGGAAAFAAQVLSTERDTPETVLDALLTYAANR